MMLSTRTMTTQIRSRFFKEEGDDHECDSNGNVAFCKSANGFAPMTDLNQNTEKVLADGHGLTYGELRNGDAAGGASCNGITHHLVNGETPSVDAEIKEDAGRQGWTDLLVSVKVLVTAMAGVVFGFAMEKGRVFEPYNIRGQMLYQNFVMLKMFLSAIFAGIMVFSVLSNLPFTMVKFSSARMKLGCRMDAKGPVAAGIGGAMLGMGMALSGACPGAVLIEVGAGVQNASLTFVGCLLGALLYGLTEQPVNRWLRSSLPVSVGKLDQVFSVPYHALALPLALVIGLVLALIEVLAPWETELTSPNAEHSQAGAAGVLAHRSWPPILAGALVGCLQLPIVLSVDEPIGGSRGYCTLVSRAFSEASLESLSSYLHRSRTGLKNWWQVVYITSAIAGAALSANFSGTWGSTDGVRPLHALLGGAVMVYGSRLAGGCTSGHGLSGIALLSLLSFIAIPAMFVGGTLTAITMTLLGIY